VSVLWNSHFMLPIPNSPLVLYINNLGSEYCITTNSSNIYALAMLDGESCHSTSVPCGNITVEEIDGIYPEETLIQITYLGENLWTIKSAEFDRMYLYMDIAGCSSESLLDCSVEGQYLGSFFIFDTINSNLTFIIQPSFEILKINPFPGFPLPEISSPSNIETAEYHKSNGDSTSGYTILVVVLCFVVLTVVTISYFFYRLKKNRVKIHKGEEEHEMTQTKQ